MVRNWSMRGACGMLLRGYFGFRGRASVLGRWNDTEVCTLRERWPCAPLSAAFFAALAFVSFGVVFAAAYEKRQHI